MRILYLPNAYSQQRQYEKPANIYPVLLAMEATWYKKQGHEVYWGNAQGRYNKIISEPEGLPFLSLPHPDRIFTRAKEYTSGNYKYLPGTHIMSASGCWHGKCSFCIENGKPYEVRSVEDVISEIEECKKLNFKEIFDDSASFPKGKWFREFCYAMQKTKLNKQIKFSCNMRLEQFAEEYQEFDWLKFYGFRMILIGIESANQKTLDKIGKEMSNTSIIQILKRASENGLEPHIAVMFGYPWETDGEAIRTLQLVHYLLKKGYTKTAQASFFQQKGIVSNEAHRKYVHRIYDVWKSPQFWFNQMRDIHNKNDLKYLWKKIKEGIKGR